MTARISPARLCAFNAGIQVVWGAILAVELQARIVALTPALANAVTTYAWIAAFGAAIATVVQLLAGVSSDRRRARGFGRQIFYGVGVAVSVPAIIALLVAPSLVGVALAFAAVQIGMNIAGGPYQAIIPDFVEPERRGIASSWMSAYQSFGNAIGLAIAGLIADLRTVAVALIIPFVASYGVSASYVLGRTPQTVHAVEHRRTSRALVALLVSRGLINIGFFTLLGFLAFYVRESLGASDLKATGFLFLAFTLAGVGGAAASARATDRFDKRAIVSISVGVIAIALATLALASSFAIAYIGAILAGVAWGSFVTADWALATTTLAPGSMATAMAVWNIATTVSQVIAPLATAPLVLRMSAAHRGAGPRAAIVLALVEFVLGGAAIWFVPARRAVASDALGDQFENAVGDVSRGLRPP